ncbi:MAG TPA: fibronectin type III domain-containing protein [Candidatus Angelobacter sp.]|nr:fibronectin type III domain-containing protein [Candidatus Angelobacter sp.]
MQTFAPPQLIQPAGVQVNMGRRITKFGLAVILLGVFGLSGARGQSSDDADSLPAVRITHGPVVENVTDTTATIAWSTNVNSGTTLRYGTAPNHLDQGAGMPWGGFTHRVYLKNLQPGTKYFFQAESGKAQGTGTSAIADVMSFETRSSGNTPTP